MKKRKLELTGKQFGRITITGKATKPRSWVGTCDCSPETPKEFNGSRLANGRIIHCGCQRVSHGHTAGKTRSPTYISWQDMIARCKALQVTEADGTITRPRKHDRNWLTFDGFLKDMGERPLGTTLDRIDPLGNYVKGNCRWATRKVQDFNKTNTKMYCAEPHIQNMCGSALDWAEFFTKELGVPMSVEEFKVCVKFFTVQQLRCCIHPLAPDVAGIRKLIEAEKKAKWAALMKQVGANRQEYEPEDTGQVVEEIDEYEDTGYVPEDYPMVVNSKIEAEAITAEAPMWDGGEALARDFFKRSSRVRPDC